MDLNQIRKILVDCENSIIFGILERSGWKYDPEIYRNNNSIFFKLLRDTELIHAKYGRYSCPEEHPFSLDIDKTNNYKYELSDFLSSDPCITSISSFFPLAAITEFFSVLRIICGMPFCLIFRIPQPSARLTRTASVPS